MEGRESRDSLQAKGKRLWQVLLIWEGWSCTESCFAASAEKKSSCQIPSPQLCYTCHVPGLLSVLGCFSRLTASLSIACEQGGELWSLW